MSIQAKRQTSEEKIVYTTCNSHCGGTCILKVHVKDGVITRIETDDGEEPQFRACLRGRAYRQRIYAPDRLGYPLKRVGERGEDKFERISWDEALGTIASEMIRIKETYGQASILLVVSAGDIGWVHTAKAIDRLFGLFGGCSRNWGFFSYEAGIFAELANYGSMFATNTGDDLLNSKLIILWSLDPVSTKQETNTMWHLIQAKEAGIKIICVDPRYTNSTAVLADKWIPIRPGTDTAVMMAMAYVMIKENLHDQKFLDTYTAGFDVFRDYVLGIEDGIPKTPEWAEAISGMPAQTIAELAREYATTKPAALIAGIAPGRTDKGEQYHRAAMTLTAMTGNIGIRGGSAGGRSWTGGWGGHRLLRLGRGMRSHNPIEDDAPPLEHPLPTKTFLFGRGSVNTHLVNDAIIKGKSGGYPADYKMLYIINHNFVNQHMNINETVKAMKALEFIVTQEQFMTPTAKFADIILPTATYMERNDVTYGGATPFYGAVNKVIEPLYECKPHLEIAEGLAAKLGVTDFSDKTEDEWLRDITQKSIPDYDSFKREGSLKVHQSYVAYREQIEDPANNPFPTPSGKIEIYCQRLAELNDPLLPPIPKYLEPRESRNDPLAKKYPLQLITSHPRRRAHTQFENLPWLRELVPQAIMVNTSDAKARGISDGDLVRVFNDRGETRVPAWVTQRIMPGVVELPEGAWYDPDKNGVDWGGNPNVLTKNQPSPCGAFTGNTGLVQVEKAKEVK